MNTNGVSCPRCGLYWGCSCSDYQIRQEAEEKDWLRDYNFNDYEKDRVEEYIKQREGK